MIVGCSDGSKSFKNNITEGVIEYEVTYPELDSNNIMLEMLPDKMVMKFKGDKYISRLQTAAGIIEMAVLADGGSEKMYNLVKIFSDYYSLEMNKEEALAMTNVLPPFRTEFLDDSKIIADARCKKVLLDFGTAKDESYIFYYTNDVSIPNPNWCTPYHEIDGVLLDYRLENYDMNMRFKAIRIIPQQVDDKEFEIGEEYDHLTPEEFDKLVVRNMKIFME